MHESTLVTVKDNGSDEIIITHKNSLVSVRITPEWGSNGVLNIAAYGYNLIVNNRGGVTVTELGA